MKWVLRCLRKYAGFAGRAGIEECFVFGFFVTCCLSLALGTDLVMGWKQENIVTWVDWYPAFEITRLALVLPFFAVTARRLHDTNRSGWMSLLWFVPIVGWIWLMLMLAQPGDQDANPYGAPAEADHHAGEVAPTS
ncbi:MAG: DUF805 domain-containing protein [Myxococcota bacterium]|jgi:uncharacterized membrane protein YhaH (DUF805 family)|nr:DUF805 domain-containing protein [Myxococcota bacterium]